MTLKLGRVVHFTDTDLPTFARLEYRRVWAETQRGRQSDREHESGPARSGTPQPLMRVRQGGPEDWTSCPWPPLRHDPFQEGRSISSSVPFGKFWARFLKTAKGLSVLHVKHTTKEMPYLGGGLPHNGGCSSRPGQAKLQPL